VFAETTLAKAVAAGMKSGRPVSDPKLLERVQTTRVQPLVSAAGSGVPRCCDNIPAIRALLGCALLLTQAFVGLAGDLEAYFLDVEGGKATLMVSPSDESLLIDTGLPRFNNRDADRIVDAAKVAGVTKIDNLVFTLPRGPRGRRAAVGC